jgi:signal transduction histidine kinase
LGEFIIDDAYVHSALMNILENAIDACNRDETEKNPKIKFNVKANGATCQFEIRDNGIGMDRAIRQKIFSPFFSSKGRGGTGLGLFVANTIIQQHGGTIQVESTSGQGTLFRVTLPKQEDK